MFSALKRKITEHSSELKMLKDDHFDDSMSHQEHDDDDQESCSQPDQWDARVSKCRERNREHAKKTRLRKKIGIDSLKKRLLELQNEVNLSKYILCSYPVLYKLLIQYRQLSYSRNW